MILLSTLVLSCVGLVFPWFNAEGFTAVWFGLLGFAVISLGYYGANHHARIANRLLLRATALSLSADDTMMLWFGNDSFAEQVRATGTSGLEVFEASPQLVGADLGSAESSGGEADFSVMDRMARDPFIAPRLAPLAGIICSVGVVAFNHWMAVSENRYYPIVLYIMPPVFFLGIAGLFRPSIFFAPSTIKDDTVLRRRARVILITIGLVVGVLLHGWLYQFSMEPTIPYGNSESESRQTD